MRRSTASVALATAAKAPIAYWLFGGSDPAAFAQAEQAGRVNQDVPSNHQATFAPVIEPTLTTGIEALTAAALAWLGNGNGDSNGAIG